jgi:hypothetical protein
MRLVTALGVLLALAGCVTHGVINPVPSVAEGTAAAEIVILRESRFAASPLTVPVTLNGLETFGLHAGEYVVMRVPPGDHIVGTKYQGFFGWEHVTVALRAEPGERYYYRIDTGSRQLNLNRIPPQLGQHLMTKTTRLQ